MPPFVDPGEAKHLQEQIDALKRQIANIPVYPPPDPGTTILPGDAPGRAVLQRPMGAPYGALQAIWQREWYDVRLYGASFVSGDPIKTTDAVNSAIRAMNQNYPGILYFPAGRYNLNGEDLFAIERACVIMGDGSGVTELTFGNGGFTSSADGQDFGVCGLTMLTDGTSGFSDAIAISDGTSGGTGTFCLSDLAIMGWDRPIYVSAPGRTGFIRSCHLGYATTGIDLTGSNVFIENLWMKNVGDTDAVGIRLNGEGHRLSFITLFPESASPSLGIWVETGNYVQISEISIQGATDSAIQLDAGTSGCRVVDVAISNVEGSTAIAFDPSEHFVSAIQGLGGNTDTTYDSRRELSVTTIWDPASIRPLESVTEEFTLSGAQPGDQVVIGTPYDLGFGQVSGIVTAADTVTITVTNLGTDTIDLSEGEWSIRIFH